MDYSGNPTERDILVPNFGAPQKPEESMGKVAFGHACHRSARLLPKLLAYTHGQGHGRRGRLKITSSEAVGVVLGIRRVLPHHSSTTS